MVEKRDVDGNGHPWNRDVNQEKTVQEEAPIEAPPIDESQLKYRNMRTWEFADKDEAISDILDKNGVALTENDMVMVGTKVTFTEVPRICKVVFYRTQIITGKGTVPGVPAFGLYDINSKLVQEIPRRLDTVGVKLAHLNIICHASDFARRERSKYRIHFLLQGLTIRGRDVDKDEYLEEIRAAYTRNLFPPRSTIPSERTNSGGGVCLDTQDGELFLSREQATQVAIHFIKQ